MFAHGRDHCALCLPHATLLQRTPPRNSPSRSFCSCVLQNTPSGAQFNYVCMKTSAKHRLRSPTPPRSSLESCNLSSTLPPCPQPSPTLLLDAATQTPPHNAASADATTQILWIARSHHRHMDLPTAPHCPNPVTLLPSTVSAVPAAPADLMLVHTFHERHSTLHHHSHQVLRIKLP